VEKRTGTERSRLRLKNDGSEPFGQKDRQSDRILSPNRGGFVATVCRVTSCNEVDQAGQGFRSTIVIVAQGATKKKATNVDRWLPFLRIYCQQNSWC
jgi:hypothetical protein